MAEEIKTNLPINQPNNVEKYQQQVLGAHQELLDLLKNQMEAKPNLMQSMAQFGKPTRTGAFAESAQMFNEDVANQQKAIEERKPSLVQMRSQIAQSGYDMAKKNEMRNIAGTFLQPLETKDESGAIKKSFVVNPNAMTNLLKYSDNPIEDMSKYAQAIPNLRKAGLLGSRDAEGTPFDGLAMMVTDPLIKKQVEQYAKQYKNGTMDDDKANALANQILTMYTSHMDRKQQAQFSQSMQIFQSMIAQQNLELRKSDFERKKEEDSKKLTDEQKIVFKNVITPILSQGTKAYSAMQEFDAIEKDIMLLPESIVGNAKQFVIGTEARKAARQIEAATQRLKTMVPRLPGSQSNYDSANIEKGLGQLTDPTFSRADKLAIWNSVKESFQRLANDADRYEMYWDKYKKIAPPQNRVVDINDLPSEKGAK